MRIVFMALAAFMSMGRVMEIKGQGRTTDVRTTEAGVSMGNEGSGSGEGAAPGFQFALVSDTHIGDPTGADDLRRTVKDINANPDIRFVIISGDITEFGADAEFLLARQIFDSLQKPWHIIPGNHDDNWSESGTNSFRKIFGSETFSFSYGGFFFLGNNCGPMMRMGPGQVPHEHIVWMDSVLRHLPDPKMPVVFVNHYPQDSALNNWYEVIRLLKQHNTQLILCGHGHANHTYDFDGIPGVMGRSNLRAKALQGGYNIVRMTEDSAIFEERRPADTVQALELRKRWTAVRLYDHQYDSSQYPRPSYAVNDRYPGVREKWIYQDKADIGCGMAVAGDVIITADTKGEVFALDGKSGRRRWTYATGGKIFSTPAVEGERVVVASTDGTIYCMGVKDGKLLWKYGTDGPIVASPAIGNGIVFIGSSKGQFRAIRLTSGKQIWEFDQVIGFVADKPLLYMGNVYFASWKNDFYALDQGSGRLVWKWNNGAANRMFSAASCIPVGAGGRIFIVAPDRYMTVFKAADGAVAWRKHWDSSWVRESMGLSADSSLVYVKTMQGKVLGVEVRSDTAGFAWHSELELGYELDPSAMHERAGVVYVPSDKGVAAGADRATGKVLWMHKVSNSLINMVLPFGDSVLVSTMDGKLVCLTVGG